MRHSHQNKQETDGFPAYFQRVEKVFSPRCAVFQTFFKSLENLFD